MFSSSSTVQRLTASGKGAIERIPAGPFILGKKKSTGAPYPPVRHGRNYVGALLHQVSVTVIESEQRAHPHAPALPFSRVEEMKSLQNHRNNRTPSDFPVPSQGCRSVDNELLPQKTPLLTCLTSKQCRQLCVLRHGYSDYLDSSGVPCQCPCSGRKHESLPVFCWTL